MSGLAGIFHRDGAPVNRRDLNAMLTARPERGTDASAVMIDGPAGLGFQLFRLLPEDRARQQPLALDGLLLAADCRLDNCPELRRELGLAPDQPDAGDAALIMMAYRRWGEACSERLLGDFAFVIWDGPRQTLFAARDAMGQRSLAYALMDGVFLIASEIVQLMAHPVLRPRVNDDRVAAYLIGLWDRPEETFIRDVRYLLPGHALSIAVDRFELRRYWQRRPRPVRYRDEREYADHYRELLTTAVRDRLRVDGLVGVSLSGGLDSTSLAALAAPALPQTTGQSRLMSFSYTFEELESCDERVYIRPVVDRYGLEPTYIPSDDLWSFKNIPDLPSTPDFILADSFIGLPLAAMAAAKQAGVRLLLGGYFGDALMTGEYYWALDMLCDGRFGLLGRTIATNRRTIRWRYSLFENGLRRLVPPRAAQGWRRIRPRKAEAVAPGIHEDLVARTDLCGRLSPDPPPDELRAPGLAQRYESLMTSAFSQGFAASRFLYNRHGMELAMPYYDLRLVEFVLGVPAYVLGGPGRDRFLHREAMKGLLPETVRQRQRPTSFAPLLAKGLQDKEKETIKRFMAKPSIVGRGYIRGDWLAAQLAQAYEPSPGWYLLLKAIHLEVWLRRFWN